MLKSNQTHISFFLCNIYLIFLAFFLFCTQVFLYKKRVWYKSEPRLIQFKSRPELVWNYLGFWSDRALFRTAQTQPYRNSFVRQRCERKKSLFNLMTSTSFPPPLQSSSSSVQFSSSVKVGIRNRSINFATRNVRAAASRASCKIPLFLLFVDFLFILISISTCRSLDYVCISGDPSWLWSWECSESA